jgi:hypothetical protein
MGILHFKVRQRHAHLRFENRLKSECLVMQGVYYGGADGPSGSCFVGFISISVHGFD